MPDKHLKTIITEEETKQVASKVLDKVVEKLEKELRNKFYDEIRAWLFEHHMNFEHEIFDEVFEFICGKGWSRYRDKYNATKLRARLYEIHKKDIDKLMTEQLVEENIKRFFNLFLSDEAVTGWKYTDLEGRIVDWFYENYSRISKLKNLMPKKLIRENENLRREIKSLEGKLAEVEELIS